MWKSTGLSKPSSFEATTGGPTGESKSSFKSLLFALTTISVLKSLAIPTSFYLTRLLGDANYASAECLLQLGKALS